MARLAHKLMVSNNLLVLDAVWFGCTYTTGIIVCEDIKTKKIKCYIDGTDPDNKTEEEDIKQLLSFGAYFPNKAAEPLFKHIDFTKGWTREHPEYFL